MNVDLVDMYMIRQKGTRITESLLEQPLRIFRTIGYVRSVALVRKISHR